MTGIVEVSIVVSSQELWKKTLYRDPCFKPFTKSFEKTLSICTSFHNDLLKTWPDIRNFVFLLNEKLCRKFGTVLKVCRHKQNTKTGISLDLDLTLTCGYFLKTTSKKMTFLKVMFWNFWFT